MTTESELIALAGLSDAQRHVLVNWRTPDHYHHWSVVNLIAKGLLDYRRRWYVFGAKGVYITRLGHRVRDHLRAAAQVSA